MFTGLVEETGTVKALNIGNQSGTITICADQVLNETKIGDSIAVNGICLTVTDIKQKMFSADIMSETFRRSSLGKLKVGSKVNLERAMLAGGRFGGHIVSGHIDGTGVIRQINIEENAVWYSIETDKKLLKYIVEKGSITVDGISLTVAYADMNLFKVSIIPHTRKETMLSDKKIGDVVNLECDMIGKYIERLMAFKESDDSKLTLEFLKSNGF